MKKKRYTEEQIIGATKQHESGVKVDDLCRQLGISAEKVLENEAMFFGSRKTM